MAKNVKTAVARWIQDRQFQATTGSGHELTLDGAAGADGRSYGPSPMEVLLVGMAGCTGIDVVDILKKKRQTVSGVEVRVEGTRAETPPMVYTEIDVVYVVRGKDISPKAVEDAIQLSESKYCSASVMLRKTAKITSRYEIIPE